MPDHQEAYTGHSGPYIITTTHAPEHDGATGYVASCRAVATLVELAARYAAMKRRLRG